MESKLIDWIREVREQDFIVETWMLVIEGRKLLEALYPWVFKNECKFDFSNSWVRGFLKRHNYSHRTVTNTKSWNVEGAKTIEMIRNFHIDTRAFQLTKMIDNLKRDDSHLCKQHKLVIIQ